MVMLIFKRLRHNVPRYIDSWVCFIFFYPSHWFFGALNTLIIQVLCFLKSLLLLGLALIFVSCSFSSFLLLLLLIFFWWPFLLHSNHSVTDSLATFSKIPKVIVKTPLVFVQKSQQKIHHFFVETEPQTRSSFFVGQKKKTSQK